MADSEKLPEQPKLSRIQTKDGHEFAPGIERGMVFWAEVRRTEARGTEQYHDHNPCPWVVVSSDKIHRKMPLVQAAPLTTKVHKAGGPFLAHRILVSEKELNPYSLAAGETPLRGEKVVLTEQVRILAHARLLGNPVAKFPITVMAAIETGLRYVLDLPV
jgi:mRNA-degrading endonuclease toxin of MazEF toxin-antitoxin module